MDNALRERTPQLNPADVDAQQMGEAAEILGRLPKPPLALVGEGPKAVVLVYIDHARERFHRSTCVTRTGDRVIVSQSGDHFSTMMHFTVAEWEQIVAAPKEGT